MMNGTMTTARHVLESARDGAAHTLDSAREGTERAVTTSRSKILDGIHAATGLLRVLRSLEGDDMLGWIGLARRTSPVRSLAIFAAGMAVGAGAGLLLAPSSGSALRRSIVDRLKNIEGGAQAAATEMGSDHANGKNEVANRPAAPARAQHKAS